jgi:hypothetical protein
MIEEELLKDLMIDVSHEGYSWDYEYDRRLIQGQSIRTIIINVIKNDSKSELILNRLLSDVIVRLSSRGHHAIYNIRDRKKSSDPIGFDFSYLSIDDTNYSLSSNTDSEYIFIEY